jgi:hypothetical protein
MRPCAQLDLADGERREVEALKITSPVATFEAGRGVIERRGNVLRLTLRP